MDVEPVDLHVGLGRHMSSIYVGNTLSSAVELSALNLNNGSTMMGGEGTFVPWDAVCGVEPWLVCFCLPCMLVRL